MTAPGARVLVTGGTGRLGRVLTPLLAAAGYDVAVVSRRTPQAAGTQPDQAVPPQGTLRVRQVRADLVSGDGLGAALDGVEVVVHLATANGRRDVAMMRHLVTSSARIQAAGATPPHLIYLSIVGCDCLLYTSTRPSCWRACSTGDDRGQRRERRRPPGSVVAADRARRSGVVLSLIHI